MHELDALGRPGKDHGMIAHHRAATQRGKADVASAAGAGMAVAPALRALVEIDAAAVTTSTSPDWEPIMKVAAAIVTERGGRTCHAAIVARELGVPAVVGAAGARDVLQAGRLVTVSRAEGDVGRV